MALPFMSKAIFLTKKLNALYLVMIDFLVFPKTHIVIFYYIDRFNISAKVNQLIDMLHKDW